MKPRAILAPAVDAALFAAVCAAYGLVLALAWDVAAHGQHSFLRAIVATSPAVSTSASAFRSAGRGEAAGDSFAPAPAPENARMEIDQTFLAALAAVESGGDDAAINFADDAHGRYQITALYLADANAALGTRYTLAEMHDPDKAARIVTAYLTRYGRAFERRTGREATAADLARIHNGGPRGAEREATLGYAERFHRAYLEARHA